MNGSSILKKTLPILCSIVLIIIIALVVSSATRGGKYIPEVSGKDENYITIKEKLNNIDYEYSLTKDELYKELKKGVGLSGTITLLNREVLKTELNGEVSFWKSITKEEIDQAITEGIYGDEAKEEGFNPDTVTDKDEKIQEFKDTMFSGYGYESEEDVYASEQIRDHYNLVLAKKLYAKVKLNQEYDEKKGTDEPYFTDTKIEDYFDENYNKDYSALIIPFTSSEKATLALQQLGVAVDSGKWVHQTLVEKAEGSGVYEIKNGEPLTTTEVVNTFIALYNMVYGYKKEDLVEGTATITTDSEGKKYYVFSDGCDYAVINSKEKIESIKPLLQTIKTYITATEKDNALTEIAKVEAILKDITDTLAFNSQTSSVSTIVTDLKDALSNADTKNDPTILIENLIKAIDNFDTDIIVFNTDNKESKLFYKYSDLYAYDSKLPSELKNNRTSYVPYKIDATEASLNSGTIKWYSTSPVSYSPMYYFILKISEGAAPVLEDVKDEIVEKLKEAELTDEFIEKKMASLRAEYNIQILDEEIENQYIEAIKSYDVDYKESKKSDTNFIAKISKDKYQYNVTADTLFDYMEKTSALSTVISELSYQRLMYNTLFNKYFEYNDGKIKWIGDEGEDKRDEITEQIENQRIYFLSGSYSSYGYDPSTMSWEDFLKNVNGADDEVDLAYLILYSTISTEFMKEVTNITATDGEGKDMDLAISYEESAKLEAWNILKAAMDKVLKDYFSVTGEHLLVSAYKTVNEAANSGTPLDPTKGEWTEEQVAGAKELIKEVQTYLNSAEGTYSQKLQNVVTAFNAAPYAVKGADGNYVKVIDSSSNEYKYILKTAECEIDLAKYKSLGLSLKYESLSTFTNGKMVKNFEDAAKSIWEKDMLDEAYNRITVYEDPIDTEFGYHLYVNLASQAATEYDGIVVNEKGEVEYETVDGESVAKTEEGRVLPSLYEIRLNALLTALNAIDQTTLSEEDAAAVKEKIAEITPLLSTAATTAITTFASTALTQLTGTSFSSILQQSELKDLIKDTTKITFNSSLYNTADLLRIIEINRNNVYEDTLTSLTIGDEELVHITQNLVENNK